MFNSNGSSNGSVSRRSFGPAAWAASPAGVSSRMLLPEDVIVTVPVVAVTSILVPPLPEKIEF